LKKKLIDRLPRSIRGSILHVWLGIELRWINVGSAASEDNRRATRNEASDFFWCVRELNHHWVAAGILDGMKIRRQGASAVFEIVRTGLSDGNFRLRACFFAQVIPPLLK
jgi:hypothetical protein